MNIFYDFENEKYLKIPENIYMKRKNLSKIINYQKIN